MFKKSDFLLVAKDRFMVGLLLGVALGSIVIISISLVQLQASDVQVPVRYSEYDQNIFRDKWYSLLIFTGFGVMMLLINGLIGVKLYGHSQFLAKGFLAISLVVMAVGLIVTLAVFRLASLSV